MGLRGLTFWEHETLCLETYRSELLSCSQLFEEFLDDVVLRFKVVSYESREQQYWTCEIWGSDSGVADISGFLGCCAVSTAVSKSQCFSHSCTSSLEEKTASS